MYSALPLFMALDPSMALDPAESLRFGSSAFRLGADTTF